MRANCGYIAVLMIALSLPPKSDLANAAENNFLFERGNFRIHYVSSGGNCAGYDWIALERCQIDIDTLSIFHVSVAPIQLWLRHPRRHHEIQQLPDQAERVHLIVTLAVGAQQPLQ